MSRATNDFAFNRRAFISRSAGSLGGLALAHLLAQDRPAKAAQSVTNPLAPKTPHHAPRAKAVICLFQHGGPSQMDLFDPKPELAKRHGQKYGGDLEVHFHTQIRPRSSTTHPASTARRSRSIRPADRA